MFVSNVMHFVELFFTVLVIVCGLCAVWMLHMLLHQRVVLVVVSPTRPMGIKVPQVCLETSSGGPFNLPPWTGPKGVRVALPTNSKRSVAPKNTSKNVWLWQFWVILIISCSCARTKTKTSSLVSSSWNTACQTNQSLWYSRIIRAWFVCHRHYPERTKTFVLGFVFVLAVGTRTASEKKLVVNHGQIWFVHLKIEKGPYIYI